MFRDLGLTTRSTQRASLPFHLSARFSFRLSQTNWVLPMMLTRNACVMRRNLLSPMHQLGKTGLC
jgi:hypothetical protein